MHGLSPDQDRVLRRILACRTAALGAHLCICEVCGWSAPVYNSCRDRHCPQCQGRATDEWLVARQARMLPVPHFQVVFTLPAELRALARANQGFVYTLLLRVASSVLQDLAAQRLGARLGVSAFRHAWTSELDFHPHVHRLVIAGGLAIDGDDAWVPTRPDFLFPGRVMGKMFRGRFLRIPIRGSSGSPSEARPGL